jgi:hypothetical protein
MTMLTDPPTFDVIFASYMYITSLWHTVYLEREGLVVMSFQTPRYNAVETLFVSGIGISNSMPPKRRAEIKRSEEQTSEQRQKGRRNNMPSETPTDNASFTRPF